MGEDREQNVAHHRNRKTCGEQCASRVERGQPCCHSRRRDHRNGKRDHCDAGNQGFEFVSILQVQRQEEDHHLCTRAVADHRKDGPKKGIFLEQAEVDHRLRCSKLDHHEHRE